MFELRISSLHSRYNRLYIRSNRDEHGIVATAIAPATSHDGICRHRLVFVNQL